MLHHISMVVYLIQSINYIWLSNHQVMLAADNLKHQKIIPKIKKWQRNEYSSGNITQRTCIDDSFYSLSA